MKGELLLDCRSAPLQISVAHGAVEIHCGFLDALEAVQIKRSFVDHVGGRAREIAPPGNEIGVRRHGGIESVADTVADSQRRQERQDQIRTGTRAPNTEGLAGIFVSLFYAESILGDIKKSSQSNGAVNGKSCQFSEGTHGFRLQAVVHDAPNHGEIVEKIVEAALNHIG